MLKPEAIMFTAAHKSAPVPSDALYFPLHVGHSINPIDIGFTPDDSGNNISYKNASYCELTGLFWAWKNTDSDAVGLSHYRRYFVGKAEGPNGSSVLSSAEAKKLMEEYDLVLGKPRNYLVETIESHYRNGHHGDDLDLLRAAVSKASPDMLDAYDTVFNGRKLSLYNMFLMRREHFDVYAEWLFKVLALVEDEIDNDSRTAYQQRTFGYLGERLLNVWAVHSSRTMRVSYRKIVNSEGEPKIRKALGMVKRKALGSFPAR